MKVLSLSRLNRKDACSRRRTCNMCAFIYRDLKPENILLDDNGKDSAFQGISCISASIPAFSSQKSNNLKKSYLRNIHVPENTRVHYH